VPEESFSDPRKTVEAPGGASTLTKNPLRKLGRRLVRSKLLLFRVVGGPGSCRYGVQTPFDSMKRSTNSLIGQVVAVNVLLVVATLFAATAASSLNLRTHDQRGQFALLALTIILVLLVNMLMIQRRFSPLERLIERVAAIDPQQPAAFEPLQEHAGSEEVDRLAASFSQLLGRIEDERRRSGRLALRAQEEERRRLARDLHDEVNQALTAILLRLQAVSQDAPSEVVDELAEVRKLVNQAMEELLRLARQLRPTALDDHGLYSAIESQARRFSSQTGIATDLRTHGEPAELDEDREIAVFRIAQEALANVARHAEASRVDIDLVRVGERGIEMTVRDDGRGFATNGSADGLGLNGMVERARLMGGELEIDSRPGGGTAVSLRVP
jgi:two-component system sensor histidine kinase UhpB